MDLDFEPFAEGYTTRFFMSGWHPALHYVIWSRENKCRLILPLPSEQAARDHVVELQLHVTLPETSASKPTTIGVRVDDGPVENFRLSPGRAGLRRPRRWPTPRWQGPHLGRNSSESLSEKITNR
jgi:hypothetical protein